MGMCFGKGSRALRQNAVNRATSLGDFFEDNHLTKQDIKAFDAMGMDGKDVRALHNVFTAIDTDGTGYIDRDEFFTYFRFTDPTVLMLRFLSMFDTNGDGELDFREFAVAIWNFCVAEPTELINFTFDLYDEERTNYLHPNLLREVLRDAIGGMDKMTRMQEQVYESTKKIKDPLTRAKFHQFVNIHRGCFYTLFGLKKDMQRTVVNEHYWERVKRHRWNKHPINSLSVPKAFHIHGEGLLYRKRKVRPIGGAKPRKQKFKRDESKSVIRVGGRTKDLSKLPYSELMKIKKGLRTKLALTKRS